MTLRKHQRDTDDIFTTRDDMMDLYEAIEKAGKWDDFDNYCNVRRNEK